ncbi:HmuU [Candidatus Regiella insecticola 5.15]|uniref:HmuU n=1 Tax=Candidatus Regiella insecticola 5.15 TaxID=1005043 RepID=G2H1G0_9ENTR|nr:iron ABC transporter permease [Candidatus Regiella insecticola]EGY28168.1 HmuU [Candidatus Regiella insecticola 5.15]
MRAAMPPLYTLSGLFVLLILLIIGSSNLGALPLSFRTLWHSSFDDIAWQIWLNIRLPRVLLAILIGFALATSGAVMQGLFRNPLADPGLLGISSGAALFVALVIVMPFTFSITFTFYSHVIAAFIGGLLISLLILSFSRTGQGRLSSLLLIGIAINALCGAAVGILSYFSNDQQLRQFSLWMMGSLSQVQWPMLGLAAAFIIPTMVITLLQAHKLNLLQLGDEEAHYLGINIQQTKSRFLLLSTLLVSTAVALSGIIGFIGLVVPHLIRMHLGADHRWLLPGAALGGACLLLSADTLARTLVAPSEMPVGLITSLIGGPYFLWLILRQQEPLSG